MGQLRRRFRLAQEARADLRAERQLRRQELDGDRALEPPVPRLVDDAHAPAPDLAVELVGGVEHALDMRAQLGVGLRDRGSVHRQGLERAETDSIPRVDHGSDRDGEWVR